jgi:hypothetical protein
MMVMIMTMVMVSGILSVWKGYIGLITWVNAKTWLSTSNNHQTPQVVRVATTAQEKMKSWRRTSRSSKSTMSSRRGLAANPSRLLV